MTFTQPVVIPSSTAALHPLQTTLPVSAKQQIKKQLRKQIHLLSYQTGLSSIYAQAKKQFTKSSVASILMYHSIPSEHELPWTDPRNCLPADLFEQQMRFLSEHRYVVSIEELTQQLSTGEPLQSGTVAITFDDGYLNNLRVAAPILAKYSLPATLYLATEYVAQSENQWIDTLYSAFRARSQHHLSINHHTWNLTNQADIAYQTLSRHLIECLPAQRQNILEAIDQQLKPTAYPPRMTMNWDEVRELHQNYPQITLGIHTANHIDLETHSDRTTEEITLAISQIESAVGIRPHHLAFPYNRYNTSAQAQAAQHLKSAVAVAKDPVVRADTSPYALPRLEGPQSLTLLKSWTNGGFPDFTQKLFKQAWTKPA